VRTGGRGKHNVLSGGAFRKAKYEKLRRRKKKWRKRGRAKILSPQPPSFLPARAEKFLFLPSEARQSNFALRIFVKKSSDFNQKVPPIFRIRVLGGCCLAPPKAGLGFGKDFEGIFEIQKQSLPAQTEVRFAEGKHKFEKFINQSFFFRQKRKAKR
jgi:hypothetical protein